MTGSSSRVELKERRAAERSRERSRARRRRARDARVRRQLSPSTHWTLYVGATMLALGVVVLAAAAILTR
jgi:hypothetical protein